MFLEERWGIKVGEERVLQRGLVENEGKREEDGLSAFSGSLTETLSSVRIACQEGKLRKKDGLSTKLLGFWSKRGSLLSGCGCYDG